MKEHQNEEHDSQTNHKEVASLVVRDEINSLKELAANIPDDFGRLVEDILSLKGKVAVIGMGKSGHIAKKLAASLASTGTPAFFIHPGEASHGDLGMVTNNDLVIMLSNSGETNELFDTINYCKRFHIQIAAMTMVAESTLGSNADYLLLLPKCREISDINSPTNSAIMMLSLGHALFVALHKARGFTQEQFRNFHPGGKIGANLLKVKDLMYKGDRLPLLSSDASFSQIILTITEKSMGCAVITDADSKLLGIITDGDLRRHINDSDLYEKKASAIMTPSPASISEDKLVSEALYMMNSSSITTLPVTKDGDLIGILHIHDILKAGAG